VTLQHPHAELSAYIDDALDPAAQAAVDGHLVACALCRSHVAQLRATVAFVQALPDPVPSRRLVPRLAAPAWLVPLRTLMTLASGAAVFLFIASAIISNITFLTSGGATGTTAQEASRDTAAKVQAPAAAGPASTPSPAPVASGNVAFGLSPSASPSPDAARAPQGAATDDSRTRADQSTAGPAGATGAAFNPQDAGRLASSGPQRSLLNPWLWLALAIVCGGIAIALHRRLRASV
jgi:anti-sigma factor RsiW